MQRQASSENHPFRRSVLCLALLAAFSAYAEESDEVARLTQPESRISFGAGHVGGDSQRFGVYNGLGREGLVGIGDLSVVRRDDASGTWLRLQGRNLGLDNREIGAEYEQQGNWRAFIDFSQTPRVAPYEVHTDLAGSGGDRQSYPTYGSGSTRSPSAAPARTLQTERQLTRLGASKYFLPNLELKVSFQNEEKSGSRLFGRGSSNAMEFLAEPINSTTKQLDVVLDYTGERLQLSGGYYGTLYNNRNNALFVSGGSGSLTSAPAFSPIALAPDNHSHQLHLAGAYDFTKTTRGSFKLARSVVIQNDAFVPVAAFSGSGSPLGTNFSGRSSLGGRLENSLLQLGLNSRPLKDLSLSGNLRYEDRADNTAVARYVTGTGTTAPYALTASSSTTDGYNEPRSLTILSGKFEASYRLPDNYRLTGGFEREQKERSMAGVRIVGYREKTEEDSWRLEVKRNLVDTLSGSLAYVRSERSGSAYRKLTMLDGSTAYPNNPQSVSAGLVAAGGNLLQPLYLADRQRDKIRLALDWAPSDPLSLQFIVEASDDSYGRGRSTPDIGPRSGRSRLYSLDASYSLDDNWRVNAWLTRSETEMNQASIANASASGASLSTLTLWSTAQGNAVDTGGIGLRGRIAGRVEVGGDLVRSYDRSSYRMDKSFGSPSNALASLPDIVNQLNSLKLFARYEVSKDLAVRFDYILDHRKTNDWTWNGFAYSDGTWLYQRPEERVQFFGIAAIYAFR